MCRIFLQKEHTDKVGEANMDCTPMAGGVGTWTQERPLGLENQLHELLPGIPDEITLNHVTTKLSWTDVRILPSLSRTWNRAIQSRQVHCARVQSHSTETLVFVTGTKFIALYSMRAKKFEILPSIPGVDRCVECKCVSLDGRVYVLGAREQERYHIASDNVYVVDLVGRRTWEKCASMPQPVDEFVCGTLDGKICVFGFLGDENFTIVYDPKLNAWSPIMPTSYLRSGHRVAVVGGELFLHSGYRNNFAPDETFILDVYNPIRNDWRKVDTGPWLMDNHDQKQVFVTEGVFHVITETAIRRLDNEQNKWTELHSFSFAAALGFMVELVFMVPSSVLAANGELLGIVIWQGRAGDDTASGYESCLLQSRGFGGENRMIQWEKVNCSPDLGNSLCLCPVKL